MTNLKINLYFLKLFLHVKNLQFIINEYICFLQNTEISELIAKIINN